MSLTSTPSPQQIKRVPKVLLHDHLDGGLRPQTIIDIAQEIGYTALPTHDAAELATWFRESCDSGSLVRYLETFSHTIAVMQRREDVIRVARECALDLARDGVVYAEVRGAPELFTEKGLSMAADAHKWMLGPEGCAVLYVRESRLDEVLPVQIGWTNFAHYADYASRDMTLRADAGRYESGTLNTIGCYGVRAALELLLEVGIENIRPAVQSLGDQLAQGAEALGYELACARTAETGSGIVSVRKAGVESTMMVRNLKDKGIIAAPRQGWVRFAPHFYISPGDIDRVLAELASY